MKCNHVISEYIKSKDQYECECGEYFLSMLEVMNNPTLLRRHKEVNELRLHLAEAQELHKPDNVKLNKEECSALYKWLEREFIPHDENYEVNISILNKLHDIMAR